MKSLNSQTHFQQKFILVIKSTEKYTLLIIFTFFPYVNNGLDDY
jgi:hypothetical protein